MSSDWAVICLCRWHPLLCFLFNPWWPVLMCQLWPCLQSYWASEDRRCSVVRDVVWLTSFYSGIKSTPCWDFSQKSSVLCIFSVEHDSSISCQSGTSSDLKPITNCLIPVKRSGTCSKKQLHWVLWIRLLIKSPKLLKSRTWADVKRAAPGFTLQKYPDDSEWTCFLETGSARLCTTDSTCWCPWITNGDL